MASLEERNMYFQFDLVLSDVSAFLVDGDYDWKETSQSKAVSSSKFTTVCFLPIIDRCGAFVKLQQVMFCHLMFTFRIL